MWILLPVGLFTIYWLMFRRFSTTSQFGHQNYCDLWEDDGTQMEGEEAVAHLRIQRERVMPFMEEINQKLEAAGVSSGH